MLLCLAVQTLCRCRCRMQMQMQNAECRCRMQMQNALQMQIALQNCRSESITVEISNGLRARGAGPDLKGFAPCRRPPISRPPGIFLEVCWKWVEDLLEVSWRTQRSVLSALTLFCYGFIRGDQIWILGGLDGRSKWPLGGLLDDPWGILALSLES